MKTIYLVRHSKAEQHFIGNDFERKLTETGKQNSELVSKRLIEKYPSIELFISSPAKRAKTTAQQFAACYQVDKESIVYKSELYHAPSFVYEKVIDGIDNDFNSVIIFAHNPGINDYINQLGIVALDNMPTTGVFVFQANVAKWTDVAKAKKQFLYFDYPKKISS